MRSSLPHHTHTSPPCSPSPSGSPASLLRLLEKVSTGVLLEINETGTSLRYRPGLVVGGSGLSHECGATRPVGYFLEPLVLLALFAKKPLSITLRGMTSGDGPDPGVDTFRTATLPLLRRFGADPAQLELKVLRRGAPPGGGGEVLLRVSPMPSLRLTPAVWTDEGMVKRVRGVAYCCRVAPAAASRMVDAARGVLNRLLADVYIFVDHFSGPDGRVSPLCYRLLVVVVISAVSCAPLSLPLRPWPWSDSQAFLLPTLWSPCSNPSCAPARPPPVRRGRSPGFGLSLVAETTTGCILSSECTTVTCSASRYSRSVRGGRAWFASKKTR